MDEPSSVERLWSPLDELLSVGSERGDRLSLVDTFEDKGAEDLVAVFESQEMKGILAGAINRLGERERS